MSKLKRSATISIHSGLRNIIKGYYSKLDRKKTASWLNVRMLSNDVVKQGEDKKGVNRNSLEEEDDSDDSDVWDDDHQQDDVLSTEFEAFSDTDTETHEQLGDDEISDIEHEAELLDQFDENLSYRRHSSDDILEAVQAVKLNYSFPFQDSRTDEAGPGGVLLRSRTLGERLREKRSWGLARRSGEKEASPGWEGDGCVEAEITETTSRLSRLFSLRRSSDPPGYNERTHPDHGLMLTLQEEEDGTSLLCPGGPMAAPPSLPPPPSIMSPDQTKRRFIINSLVQSENNYLESLNRLMTDYKVPLEESSPPILSEAKVSTMFYRVPEILQIHSQFRIALSEAVKNWDEDEKIGDVFVACFSKSVVLEIYADFINNFSEAMDLAKLESKRKSAFGDFLKVKQISAHDRLNFFGLMVKPIQRFPQFILLLQDLLKASPPGAEDRMELQLALTTLESLAEMLNERKRECEQVAAFSEKLQSLGGKLGRTEGSKMLLREDDVQRLEFNAAGQVVRSKPRRLLLLNDRVVCVAVSGRQSEVEPGLLPPPSSERLTLKWSAHVSEVEVVEGTAAGTLARLTQAGVTAGTGKKTSLGRSNSIAERADKQMAENLAQDMADLMHDFEVVSRMNSMIGTLKCSYPGLSSDGLTDIMDQIQKSIRQKDDEMSWLDKSCLQLLVKRKDKPETLTFQMKSPGVRQDWVVELRLARLALDPNNAPGWDILEQTKSFTGRLPLYVRHLSCYQDGRTQTEILSGVSYTLLVPTPTRTLRPVTYVWANASDGVSSYLRIYSVQITQQINLKDLGTVVLSSCCARGLVHVPGPSGSDTDLVWVATDDRRILLYSASHPERATEAGRISLAVSASCLVQHGGKVYAGLDNGTVGVFRRDQTQAASVSLGSDPVACIIPVSGLLYVSCGRTIATLDVVTATVTRSFTANAESDMRDVGSVASLAGSSALACMAVCGVGLWVSLSHSSTVSLYHTESFIHMQDINIASNVSKILAAREVSSNKRAIYVTALSAAKGLLWVGTNVGIALTIPLPRLEGVPIISGKANISYHAHFGPVRMFLPLQQKVVTSEPVIRQKSTESESHKLPRKQMSETSIGSSTPTLRHQVSSPVMRSRSVSSRDSGISSRKSSKTLPRGFTMGPGSESSGDSVFGLYGDLLNVGGYECESSGALDSSTKELHNSDPELDTLPYRIGTLNRSLALKTRRPRSLDLSSWSVESKASSQTTSSSDGSVKTSPSVSRTASCASDSTSESSWVSSGRPGASSMSRTLTRAEERPGRKEKTETVQRTVTTLMGGRGYIQWRGTHLDRNKGTHLAQVNNSDAYLVIWDHKL